MGTQWKDDAELFQTMRRELYTAVVGDILDQLGRRHQFLPPECRPLVPEMVVAGRAVPVVVADVEAEPEPPFGLMLEALDSLRAHEVYFATGVQPRYALWGELMSTAARARGAAGAVLAGFTRDARGIVEMGFPVFCYGSYAQDQRYRGMVTAHHVKVELEGAVIRPGDILFGDRDGVLAIPQELETEAMTAAFEKVRTEQLAKKALAEGQSAREVFRTYKAF